MEDNRPTPSSLAHAQKEQTAFDKLWHAADAVRLTFCDDPEEYSDSERGQALDKLCAALSETGPR